MLFSSYPISCKEGLAIYFSLLHFKQFLRNKIIQLHVDNQTCCWAFEKEGSRCRVMNLIAIKILRNDYNKFICKTQKVKIDR